VEHGNEKFGGGVQKAAPAAEPPSLRPDQCFVTLGTVTFAAGKEPKRPVLLTGPGKVSLVERTGRIAWENVTCRNPTKAFYQKGYVYYDEDGVQMRVKYALPCNRTLAAEAVPAAERVAPPEKMKFDPTILDGLTDRRGYTGAALCRP